MSEDEVKAKKIDFGRGRAKELQEQLSAAARTFKSLEEILEELVDAGVAWISPDIEKLLPSFRDRLSTMVVESTQFVAVMENTYAKPIASSPPRKKIEPDKALIIQELLGALRAVTDASERISKITSGNRAEQDRYAGEMIKVTKILLELEEPLLDEDGADSN